MTEYMSEKKMHKLIYFCQLITIGVLTWSTAILGASLEAKKTRHIRSIILENNWPNPDPNINRFPHEKSCHYFYLVLSEEDVSIKKCPDGELFDYFTHNCAKKRIARCWSHHFGNIKHHHIHFHKLRKHFKCPYRYGKYPDVSDCTRYYQCLAGKAKYKKCAPFEYFDKIKRKCVAEINAICADETDVVEPGYKCPKTWGSFSFSKDCSKYYECLEKRPSIRTCPRGRLFDDKIKNCIFHKNVHCGSRHNPYEKKTTTISSMRTSVKIQEPTDKVTETREDPYLSTKFQLPSSSLELRLATTDGIESPSVSVSEYKGEGSKKNEETTDFSTQDDGSSDNDISKRSSDHPNHGISNASDESTEKKFPLQNSSLKSIFSTSVEVESSVTVSKSKDDGSKVNEETTNFSTQDYYSSENGISNKSPSDPNRGISRASDKYTDATFQLQRSSLEPTFLSSGEIKSSSVSVFKSKDDNNIIKKETTDFSTQAYNNSENNISKGFSDSTIHDISKTSDEYIEDSLHDSSVFANEFITVGETTPSDGNSAKPEIVTAVDKESMTKRYPHTTHHDEVGCHPKDSTCIKEEDRSVIRCPAADGFFPHPKDENRFLSCSNYNIRVKSCPAKLIFNDFKRACTRPLDSILNNA